MKQLAVLTTTICMCLAGAASAEAQRYLDPVFDAVELTPDVQFGSSVNNYGVDQALFLDMYRPAGDTAAARPAIVYAHGGGFRGYDRKDIRSVPILEGFAKRGFVVMSIDYRLRPNGSPGAKSDPQLIVDALSGDSDIIGDATADMQEAVRWVKANAGDLGVDPGQVIAAGESAGAITAFETAVDPSSGVAAAVSLWGAADPDHVGPGSAPVLEMHGAVDTTVPLPLGAQACGLVRVHGGLCEMVVWPQERHAAFHRAADITEASGNFLCRNAIPGCQAEGPAVPITVG